MNVPLLGVTSYISDGFEIIQWENGLAFVLLFECVVLNIIFICINYLLSVVKTTIKIIFYSSKLIWINFLFCFAAVAVKTKVDKKCGCPPPPTLHQKQ